MKNYIYPSRNVNVIHSKKRNAMKYHFIFSKTPQNATKRHKSPQRLRLKKGGNMIASILKNLKNDYNNNRVNRECNPKSGMNHRLSHFNSDSIIQLIHGLHND